MQQSILFASDTRYNTHGYYELPNKVCVLHTSIVRWMNTFSVCVKHSSQCDHSTTKN